MKVSKLVHCCRGLKRDELAATFGVHQKIGSGKCNQATKPDINESLLIVSNSLNERPLRQNNSKCTIQMKLILAVVTAAIHRDIGLGADDDLFETSRSGRRLPY